MEEEEEKEEEEGCEEEGGCYSCIVSGGIASSYPQVLTFTTPNIFQVYSLHFSKSTLSHLVASLFPLKCNYQRHASFQSCGWLDKMDRRNRSIATRLVGH